jgi:LCP family protein required for cell wall assembly
MPRRPRTGKRHVLRWVAAAVVAILAAGTLAAYLKYRAVYDSITRIAVPSTELGQRPPQYSTASENILVYGDDSRKGLDAHQQYILHTGNLSSNNTDTIMLIHLSPGRHQVTAMSIPRDTMVPQYQCDSSPGYPGQQADPASYVMINSLLAAGGPVCLWKTVEQQTGIFIDHFIGIGMLGFVKVVNDLGGVNVCVPFNVNDPVSGLDLPAGMDHINGIQALAFWRTREDLGTGSDLQRIQRDQFMSAQVVKGVLSSGLLSDPFRLLSVVTDAAASMTTDSGMTVSDLMNIANSLRHLTSKNVQFITAPNQQWPPNPARVQFAQPQAGEVFSAIAHDKTVPKVSRPSGSSGGAQLLTTSPSKVKVQVLNGSGVHGIASRAAAGLTSRGFVVTGTGNAASFAYTKSVIEYSSATDMAEVNTLERALTNVTDLRVASLKPGTLELIVGSDFTGLAPVAQSSPTSASQPSVTSSASASQPSVTSSASAALPSVTSSASASQSASASPSALAGASGGGSPSPGASASGIASLAQSNGGITAAASCTSDSSAFTGPLSP